MPKRNENGRAEQLSLFDRPAEEMQLDLRPFCQFSEIGGGNMPSDHWVRMERWEQRYTAFDFHLACWDCKTILAVVRDTRRPTSGSLQAPGIAYDAVCFGMAYGNGRDVISCMITGHFHDGISSLMVRDWRPELLACLEQYSSEELLSIASLAREHADDPAFTFPSDLFAGRTPIQWSIPQRRLNGPLPLCVGTMSGLEPSVEKYAHLKELMHRLGPRSMLIDLRAGPHTYSELERRQSLKTNTFTWPTDKAAQLLHPISLRNVFGFKYRHVPGVIHFVCTPYVSAGLCDVEVWLHRPERCNPIVDLITQGYPLVLIDESEFVGPAYAPSLRRAVAMHLLSLFGRQIEIMSELEELHASLLP